MENLKELTIKELEDLLYKFLFNFYPVEDLQIEIDQDNPKRLRLYTLVYPAVGLEPGEILPIFNRGFFKERNHPDGDNILPSKTCVLFITLDDKNVIKSISSTHKHKSNKYDHRYSNYNFEEYSKVNFVDFFRGTDILSKIKVITE